MPDERVAEPTRSDVDGVPVFWAPVDGPLIGALMFRVGLCDEDLPRLGRSHLVEHLALYEVGLARPSFSFNGHVDATTTVFHAAGEPDDVVEFFRRVTSALAELPTQRLAQEQAILRAESAERPGAGVMGALLTWRFGPQTFGLPAYEEFGLLHLTADEVTAWSRRRFTRDNAVLWLSGPPPRGLSLDLPEGVRFPVPAVSTVLPTLPAWFHGEEGVAALQAVVDRSTAATALKHVLERRLIGRLRYEQGVSYSPAAGYEPLDADHALLTALAASVKGEQSTVADTILSLLVELADEGGTDDELADFRSSRARAHSDPAAGRGWLHTRAWDWLVGAKELTYEQWIAQSAALTGADVAAAAAQARDDALYLLPRDHPPPATPVAAPAWSDRGVVGQPFLTKRPSAAVKADVLDVAHEGVTLRLPSGLFVTVWFETCAAMLSWPDGRRTLFAADAFVAPIDPRRFVDGARLPKLLDERVRPELVVPMPASDPPRQPTFGEPWRSWAAFGGLLAGTVASAAVAWDVTAFPLVFVSIALARSTITSGNRLIADRRARGLGRPLAAKA